MSYLKATISDIRTLSPSVKLFEIDLGDQRFSYQPGQWVNIELQTGAANQNAAFSITSSPNGKNAIEIAVKRVEHLPTSQFIHDQLKVGDDINISQAQGDTVLPDNIDQNQPMIFIAGAVKCKSNPHFLPVSILVAVGVCFNSSHTALPTPLFGVLLNFIKPKLSHPIIP